MADTDCLKFVKQAYLPFPDKSKLSSKISKFRHS